MNTTIVDKGHKVDTKMITSFHKTTKLAGSTYDAGGKLLIMEISFDQQNNPIVNFEVWSKTNTMLDRAPIEISTRLLDKAVAKYNSL